MMMSTKSLFTLALASLLSSTANAACSVCLDGSFVQFPDKEFEVEGIPVPNCGALDAAAGILEEGSDDCKGAQAMGTFCGCPIPENACTLCPSGARVPEDSLNNQLVNYTASDYIPSDTAPDTDMSCESMEALLHTYDKSDAQCAVIQEGTADMCDCPTENTGGGGGTPAEDTPAPAPSAAVTSMSGMRVMAAMAVAAFMMVV